MIYEFGTQCTQRRSASAIARQGRTLGIERRDNRSSDLRGGISVDIYIMAAAEARSLQRIGGFVRMGGLGRVGTMEGRVIGEELGTRG